MRQAEREPNGTYRIPLVDRISSYPRVLDGAIPASVSSLRYGWIRGAFPSPDPGGCYIVEFVERYEVRILGYIDSGAHVYKTDHVAHSAFGGQPALQFARVTGESSDSSDKNDTGVDTSGGYGYVQLCDDDGVMRNVAEYVITGGRLPSSGRFSFTGSWVDLGADANDINGDARTRGLSYEDALARCFFAFVVRADMGGARVLQCGLDGIDLALRTKSPVKALQDVLIDVSEAEFDDSTTPPALARHFARWLVDAEVEKLSKAPDSYQLITTARYSDLYFLLPISEDAMNVPRGVHNAVEAAINMYKLTKDALGGNERAFLASMEEVSKAAESVLSLDPYSIASVFGGDGLSDAKAERLEESSSSYVFDKAVGEWDWRSALSVMIEGIPAPNRVEAEFHGNLKSGIVSIASVASPVRVMPKHRWDGKAGEWVAYSDEERENMARSYAITVATTIIACAFASSSRISEVRFSSAFVENDDGYLVEPVCRIVVSRDRFFANDRYRSVSEDPLSIWLGMSGELLGVQSSKNKMANWDDVREYLGELVGHVGSEAYRDYPEIADGEVPDSLKGPLCADYVHDMRITYNSLYRRNAERLADELVETTSDFEAVRIARSFQAKVKDPFDDEALTRVMSSLVQGDLDIDDQNAVVNCYLGEDKFLTALAHGQQLFKDNPTAALSHVLDLLDEVEAAGEFDDDLEVVHRGFDSYASRLVYNAIREGALDVRAGIAEPNFAESFDFGLDDGGKSVELVPHSLLLTYVTAAFYLEQSFDGFDRAVELAKRAIKMAPTVVEGYRQLARAYMLVGDAEAAANVLKSALLVSVSPGDVGVLYYQLGYALWKMGSYQAGALCYMKAAETSPQVAAQAISELRELIREGGIENVASPGTDEGLKAAGIPVAPLENVIDSVMLGAKAATDMGMFGAAREMLSVGFRYRPDDALVNVIRSLADD